MPVYRMVGGVPGEKEKRTGRASRLQAERVHNFGVISDPRKIISLFPVRHFSKRRKAHFHAHAKNRPLPSATQRRSHEWLLLTFQPASSCGAGLKGHIERSQSSERNNIERRSPELVRTTDEALDRQKEAPSPGCIGKTRLRYPQPALNFPDFAQISARAQFYIRPQGCHYPPVPYDYASLFVCFDVRTLSFVFFFFSPLDDSATMRLVTSVHRKA